MVSRAIGTLSGACIAFSLAAYGASACATELIGRVVDATNARVFAGAEVSVRSRAPNPSSAKSDSDGFFRMSGLTPGAYVLDVRLPDGNDFVARLVLLPDRKLQFLELDYSRIVPPEDDAHY